MKRLVLLRHGESKWNKENRFTGWTDIDLSEKGVEEAIRAASLLKAEKFEFEIAFTSYLKRAIRTLWIVLDEMDMMWIPVYRTWRLNEKHYGMLQGLNKKEMAEKYGEEQVHIWRRSYTTPPAPLSESDPRHPRFERKYKQIPVSEIPATESLKDTVARMIPYWEEHIVSALQQHHDVIISAHGNSLRAIIKHVMKISEEDIVSLNIPTGIPYVLEFNDKIELVKDYFLGDPEEVKKMMEKVASQGKK